MVRWISAERGISLAKAEAEALRRLAALVVEATNAMSGDKTALTLRRDVRYADELKKGEFCYARRDDGTVKWVHFWPHDCPVPLSASIAPQRNGQGAAWSLSGTEEAPTLSPSVDAKGIWHGFLVSGIAKH